MILMPGVGAYDRTIDGLPPVICQNMYPEKVPGTTGVDWVLVQSPGKNLFAGYTSLNRRGIFSAYGVFNGDIFFAEGTSLFRVDSSANSTLLTNALAGTDRVIFTSVRGSVVLTAGGQAWVYDGTTTTLITDPDLPAVTSVTAMDGRIIFMARDSDEIWWSEIFDPANIQALSFATAETFEDELVRIIADHREIWLFGQQTTEIWRPTPNADQPFQRAGDMVLEKGTLSPHSVAKADNTLLWVGQDAIVYIARGISYSRISNHEIERTLSALTQAELSEVFAFSYTDDGHIFYVLTIPDTKTYVFDLATKEWHTRTTGALTYWDVEGATSAFSATYAYGVEGISELTRDANTEVISPTPSKPGNPIFSTAIQRKVTVNIPSFTPMSIERVGFAVTVMDPNGVEEDTIPLNVSFSDDAGRTFSTPEQAIVHNNGQYNQRCTLFRHGQLRSPGRVYCIEYESPVSTARLLLGPIFINEALH